MLERQPRVIGFHLLIRLIRWMSRSGRGGCQSQCELESVHPPITDINIGKLEFVHSMSALPLTAEVN